MAIVFSALASITVTAVMVLYFRQTVKGSSTPNPATWLIWVVVGVMNLVSYYSVVRGNILEWIMTPCGTLGMIAIFIYALLKGKFGKVGATEIICIILAIIVGIIWKTRGPVVANISLQVIFAISFYPTAAGLIKGRLRERPLPWALASMSYIFLVLTVLCNFTGDDWTKLVYPIVNGVFGNGSILVIILVLRRCKAI